MNLLDLFRSGLTPLRGAKIVYARAGWTEWQSFYIYGLEKSQNPQRMIVASSPTEHAQKASQKVGTFKGTASVLAGLGPHCLRCASLRKIREEKSARRPGLPYGGKGGEEGSSITKIERRRSN